MSTSNPTLPIMERAEVHRSAKTLEGLIAVFHDYCQTVTACANLQKKLARSMKDAAGVKTIHASAANAFTAAATMLDAVSEIDIKFARLCEREYEGLSAELKKWFKKMAKEEKAHDEQAYSTQARLKLATQGYEKKVKGRFGDSTADHTRYVNQLNSLTTELNQARTAHSNYVTAKHTTVLLYAGATVTRLCDAEWGRACEEVKRSGSCVGRVGEWRAHCESGWVGQLPGELLGLDQETEDAKPDNGKGKLENIAEEVVGMPPVPPVPPIPPLPQPSSPAHFPGSPSLGTPSPAYSTLSPPPPRPLPTAPLPSTPGSPRGGNRNPSLAPPTLGSLPKASSSTTSLNLRNSVQPQQVSSPVSQPDHPEPSSAQPQTMQRQNSGYPFPETTPTARDPEGSRSPFRKPPPSFSPEAPKDDVQLAREALTANGLQVQTEEELSVTADIMEDLDTSNPTRASQQSDFSYRSPLRNGTSDSRNGETIDIFAPRPTFVAPPPPPILPPAERPMRSMARSQSIDSTASSGSMVAALRERYSAGSSNNPTSPPPGRDRFSTAAVLGPRSLQNDVTGSSRSSIPPTAFVSPSKDRRYRRPSFEVNERERPSTDRSRPSIDHSRPSLDYTMSASPASSTRDRATGHNRQRSRDWPEERDILEDRDMEATRRRRQEDLELEDRETSLRNRERDLDRQAKELERERERILQDREKDYGSEREITRPLNIRTRDWADRDKEREPRSNGNASSRGPYSPPMSAIGGGGSGSRPNTGQDKTTTSSGHASTCGCYDCSAKHYASPPNRQQDNRDRSPYSSGGGASQSNASLSGFPATQPLNTTKPGILKAPNGGVSPITPSPDSPSSDPKRKSVFANLRRLSMPLSAAIAAGTSDVNGAAVRTLMSPLTPTHESDELGFGPASGKRLSKHFEDRPQVGGTVPTNFRR